MDLQKKQEDLQRLREATDMLAAIADTVEAAREALVRVRAIATELHDPSLRRTVLAVTAGIKLDARTVIAESTPHSRGRRTAGKT